MLTGTPGCIPVDQCLHLSKVGLQRPEPVRSLLCDGGLLRGNGHPVIFKFAPVTACSHILSVNIHVPASLARWRGGLGALPSRRACASLQSARVCAPVIQPLMTVSPSKTSCYVPSRSSWVWLSQTEPEVRPVTGTPPPPAWPPPPLVSRGCNGCFGQFCCTLY